MDSLPPEGTLPSPLHPPPASGLIHELLDTAAAAVPDRTAVRDPQGSWTYRRLARRSLSFAGWLRRRGVLPGDRVLLRLPSERPTVAMAHGVSRAGAVLVPVNPRMRPYHLRSVLRSAEPRIVITDAEGRERLRGLTAVPVLDVAEVWPEAEAEPADALPAAAGAADPAVLIYTSGSTAEPKGVICPHAQMTFATRALTSVLGYRPADVVFCRFPLSWDYGLYKTLMACAARCEIVLSEGESDLTLLARLRESRATVVPIVPSMAAMILRLSERDRDPIPSVRLLTNTGDVLPRAAIDGLRERFPGARVVRQYGQTEAKRITVMPPGQDRERPDSVGLPLPGTRVMILDERGAAVPPGQVGEIVVAGPHVMAGYWRAPEETARAFRREAGEARKPGEARDPGEAGGPGEAGEAGETRLHTGDYGRLDADGYLYFEGRRDTLFKRNGVRVSALEIEAAASDIPGVRAAAVLPPGDRHDLSLFVEGELEPAEVLRLLRDRLEPEKVPRICRVLPRLPLTPHGKTSRRDLAALLDDPVAEGAG
ncbi:class I adenylate-forming enzyme family protein [Bailinhaonella thermotolerans]|uniref:Long-chain fatty acid--CoA ligase n=1 Tax=Bailinhaonella thermotolerans TaxID=1070861 RepID=A0A3A4B017_9ACTN|nr:AMP-binding protein [Bailinhaonella thermotolerans]RJL33268.1 long-chain fatty acid--CoA ligase [Bailinhaonella thermotolerans]